MTAAICGMPCADSTGPELAAYYDNNMAICGGEAYAWSGNETPRAPSEIHW